MNGSLAKNAICSFIVTNKPVTHEEIEGANFHSKFRGPDSTKILQIGDVTALHNLLSITGETTSQPVYSDDILYTFNGEIYNYADFGEYKCDTKCIVDLYKSHGYLFPKKIDGEFALCLYDFKSKNVIIASDPFRTKPLHYVIDGAHFGVATYKSSLIKLGFKNIKEFPPNTIMCIPERSEGRYISAKRISHVYEFKLDQYKDTYDDWIKAFETSIWKRTRNIREKIFIGLSSGHDSGAIFCELKRQGVPFMSYSILNNEYKTVINNRLRNRHSQNLTYKFGRVDNAIATKVIGSKVEKYTKIGYDIKKDKASLGLSSICRKALSGIPSKIYLSGCGADEIMSDYAYRGKPVFKSNSCFNGVFPEDLTDIFPWKNFYGGTQKNYLMKEEYVCGAHGIEARYPFLDVNVVQEFLHLTHTLKNKYYKAPLKHYFDMNGFPYHEFKLGFSPYEQVKL